MPRSAFLAFVLVLVGACGDDATPGDDLGGVPDAGVDLGGDADAGPLVIAAPDIPWLEAGEPPVAAPELPWLEAGRAPVAPPAVPWLDLAADLRPFDRNPPIAWACPAGWRRVAPTGLRPSTVCQPFAGERASECAAGELHLPGEAGCRSPGRACPVGTFPNTADLGGATRLHVDPAATPGGDGSLGAPFASLATAASAASSGDWLVLAKGLHAAPTSWPSGVSARGACAAETVVTTLSGTAVIAAGAPSANLTLEDLTLGPSPLPGLTLEGGAGIVALRGVVVTGTVGVAALVARGGTLVGEDLLVAGTRSSPGARAGAGLLASMGADVTLRRAELRDNQNAGAVVASGTARLEDVLVRDTLPEPGSFMFGRALDFFDSNATLTNVVLEDNRADGLHAVGGANVEASSLVVRGTRSRESDGLSGWGVRVAAESDVSVLGGLIEGNQGAGLGAEGAGAMLTASDVVVREQRGVTATGETGHGLLVNQSGAATVERAVFRANRSAGVLALNASRAELTDVTVDFTETNELDVPTEGFGVASAGGSTLTLRRAYVADNVSTSAVVQSDATLVLEDVRLVGAFPDGLAGGRGVEVVSGGTATLTRVRIDEVPANGIRSEGTLVATDLEIRDVFQLPGEPLSGSGIVVLGADATATLDRAHVERVRVVGLGVDAGRVQATDLSVVDVVGPPEVLGAGVRAQGGARLTLTRGLCDDLDYSGLDAEGGELEAEDVVVRGVATRSASGAAAAALVREAGTLTIRRALFAENTAGLIVTGLGATASAEDLRIADTSWERAASDERAPFAALASNGADVSLLRSVIERTDGFCIAALNATIDARDVSVREQRNGESRLEGYGVLALGAEADLTLERALLSATALSAAVSAEGARLSLTDARVEGTRPVIGPSEALSFGGVGATAVEGGALTLERVTIAESLEAGVASIGEGALVTLRDVTVSTTGDPICAASPECAQPPGVGLAASEGGSFDAERVELRDGETCGIQVGAGSSARLRRGLVVGHPVGICLQSAGFDANQVTEGVSFEDNDVLVESTSFPEPAPPPLPDLD
ncbi:MAG: right-handed parallel beta-helix repeat-containing protein [Myxococcota bacterium]